MNPPRIEVWHFKQRFFARQGPHTVSVAFEGDVVRDGKLWFRMQKKVLALLVVAKQRQQQLRRPPPPDSRPQRCHAKPKGKELVCRYCGIRWSVFDLSYPDCKGDQQ